MTRTHAKVILACFASFSLGVSITAAAAQKALENEEIRYKKLRNVAEMNNKVARKFAEYSDQSVKKRVLDETEFDWVVMDLDID